LVTILDANFNTTAPTATVGGHLGFGWVQTSIDANLNLHIVGQTLERVTFLPDAGPIGTEWSEEFSSVVYHRVGPDGQPIQSDVVLDSDFPVPQEYHERARKEMVLRALLNFIPFVAIWVAAIVFAAYRGFRKEPPREANQRGVPGQR
jgi:hypothetical protein